MSVRHPRKTVRLAKLNETLESHDAEIGQKMAQVLAVFHEQYIAPLEARIAELETPWWDRLTDRLDRWIPLRWAERDETREHVVTDGRALTLCWCGSIHMPPLDAAKEQGDG